VTGVPLSTGRLIITPSVGELDAAAASQTLRMDLSEGSAFAGRLGFGKHAKLNFRENTVGQDVQLTGYELDFHELGKR
jgi:hypothetical protein